jgi:hypothetical protein
LADEPFRRRPELAPPACREILSDAFQNLLTALTAGLLEPALQLGDRLLVEAAAYSIGSTPAT